MKYILIGILTLTLLVSCQKKESAKQDELQYQVTILSPDTSNKHIDDEIAFKVDFQSATKMPIHHIKVRLYNKASKREIYNQPSHAHIHEIGGQYIFTDSFKLTEDAGVEPHTDWIMEASVWGHNGREGEKIVTREFHVHPK